MKFTAPVFPFAPSSCLRVFVSKLLCFSCLAACATAWAQQGFPNRPIRAIVGFAPGGGTDIMARQIGQKLTESLGQQVIVDNRAGGGGVIAAVMARDAPPDGHTLFFGTISTLAANVATKPDLPYDPLRDYAPVTLTAYSSYFLAVHPSVPAKSTAEFIALAKARPGRLNFASSGTGGGVHLAMEYFRILAKIDMVHVPYKGAAPAVAEVIAGQVQMTFTQPATALPHAKTGRLRLLAVSARKALPSWPEAPPIADTLPGYETSTWQGVLVPARTPKPIVDRLYGEIVKALHSKELAGRLQAEGSEVGGIPPAEFGAYIKSEIAKWKRVVKEAGIKAE